MRHARTLFFIVILGFLTNSAFAQVPATSILQANQVRAVLQANGSLFNDGQQGQFVPIEAGLAEKTLLNFSSLWMTGFDPAHNLKGAVQLSGQSDFYPGYIEDASGMSHSLNHIWPVNCTDINETLNDLQDNGTIDQPNVNVFGWPSQGNPYAEQYSGYELPYSKQGLAGFYDIPSEDGIYNPADGDYPSIEIRGCPLNGYPTDMRWMVSNDIDSTFVHPSGLLPIRLEVQTQAFVYHTTEPSILNNTVFVRYKLINRANDRIDSCYVGAFADFAIGNSGDNFGGSDPARSLMYAYNGDADDEGGFGVNVPVMVLDLMRGPLDSTGEELTLSHVIFLENADNLSPQQFYRVLNGHLPNGMPVSNNGIMYPDNPNQAGSNSEVALGNTPGHRIGVASYGPFTLVPGAVNELIVAYYYVQHSVLCRELLIIVA